MAKVIKRDSLAKQVSNELESMIANGEYAVGEKIPTEPDLMEAFQVSRNTIREAVQGLTYAGILETKQGNGTFVRSSSRFQANMKQKYEEVSIDDIYEARNALEVTIAHLAAIRHDENDKVKLEEAFNSRQEQKTDDKEKTKADLEFHLAVADACHNQILIDLYSSLCVYLESHISERQVETSFTSEEIDELHKRLYEAIISHNNVEAGIAAHKILEI